MLKINQHFIYPLNTLGVIGPDPGPALFPVSNMVSKPDQLLAGSCLMTLRSEVQASGEPVPDFGLSSWSCRWTCLISKNVLIEGEC